MENRLKHADELVLKASKITFINSKNGGNYQLHDALRIVISELVEMRKEISALKMNSTST